MSNTPNILFVQLQPKKKIHLIQEDSNKTFCGLKKNLQITFYTDDFYDCEKCHYSLHKRIYDGIMELSKTVDGMIKKNA